MSENLINEIIAKKEKINENEFLNEFIEEAKEYIENIEVALLEIENDNENIELLNLIFRNIHSLKGLSGFLSQSNIEKIAHFTENILVKIKKNEIKISKIIINAILKSCDFIKMICNNINLNLSTDFLNNIEKHIIYLEDLKLNNIRIGEALAIEAGLSEEDISDLIEKQKNEYKGMKFGEIAIKEKKANETQVLNALLSQNKIEEACIKENEKDEFIKISKSKVDEFSDLIGELSIIHSQIIQSIRNGKNDIHKNYRMDKLIKKLQKNSMLLRMVSLKSTFNKLKRIIRDTAQSLNKVIEIEILGENTEIDRSVVGKLLEPLSHIIRNSIDHGIEDTEEERLKKGKRNYGKIKIEAYSQRGYVFISVKDDGKGINTEKVYKKALENNLISKDEKYTKDEINEFIFINGFSTKEKTSTISGRGVGMDVVKNVINDIGGKIEINSSENGTEFILKIPINFAVINGAIIKIGKEEYVLPTNYIKEIIRNDEKTNFKLKEKETFIKLRDKIIPLINNNQIFKKTTEEDKLIIILESNNKLKALKIKEIIDKDEIVIKSLGDEFSNLKFISGASILGNGRVALILDVENIFKL